MKRMALLYHPLIYFFLSRLKIKVDYQLFMLSPTLLIHYPFY
jgi:hypothetical protein